MSTRGATTRGLRAGRISINSCAAPPRARTIDPPGNILYYGDNLDVLRQHIPDASVNLVYLDPPFNSNATYNILFDEQSGNQAAAQIKAFEDTWRWDQAAAAAYEHVVEGGGDISRAMQAFRTVLGPSNMLAYLAMMAPRLVELGRVLKSDGSIFLHCDPTASHYLKLLLDSIFGARCFRNEITWCYYGPGSPNIRQFLRKHDTIFWYSMDPNTWTFNRDEVRIAHSAKTRQNFKEGLIGSGFSEDETLGDDESLHGKGKVPEDWWIMAIAPRSTKEYLGYPTQKPKALLDRIIRAASNPGDLVLDPFCGCGTTIEVAQELDRRWIGIDITYLATSLIKGRLTDAFGEQAQFHTVGEPITVEDAAELAADDPYQFQFWALGLIGARPADEKKGADQGIDGHIYFHDEKGGKTKQIIISVKAGKTGPAHVRDLRGVIERDDAQIGVLLTFNKPTQAMRSEAADAGFYESPGWGKSYPRLQLLTVEELLAGAAVAYPHEGGVTFKKAPRSEPAQSAPDSLFS